VYEVGSPQVPTCNVILNVMLFMTLSINMFQFMSQFWTYLFCLFVFCFFSRWNTPRHWCAEIKKPKLLPSVTIRDACHYIFKTKIS